MIRLLLGAAAAVVLPAAAAAQSPGIAAGTTGSFGRPLGTSLAAPSAALRYPPGSFGMRAGFGAPFTFNQFNRGPGFFPGFFPGVIAPYPVFYGGGFYGGGFYGGYPSSFAAPGPQPAADYIPSPGVPTRMIEMSNQFPATLTLQFPAAAKVWLDGKEVAGDPAAERVVTSPVLRPGQSYTFKVRAEWDADGKTYEYTREATLGSGDRSRVLVLSGTEKK